MLALLGGHFAEAERLIGQAAALGEECGEPGARDVRHDQDWDLRDAPGPPRRAGWRAPEMFPTRTHRRRAGCARWRCSPLATGPRRPRWPGRCSTAART